MSHTSLTNNKKYSVATEDAWTSINALALLWRLVRRGVATQFVFELRENEDYLTTAIDYSEYGFKHNFMLCVFPDRTKPAVAWLLPTSWSVNRALRRAERMAIPVMRAHAAAAPGT